jgi:hypothetical protein
MTAAKSATTRMMSDRMGQATQNDATGKPSFQYVVTTSSTSPGANRAGQGPPNADAEPTVSSTAADM